MERREGRDRRDRGKGRRKRRKEGRDRGERRRKRRKEGRDRGEGRRKRRKGEMEETEGRQDCLSIHTSSNTSGIMWLVKFNFTKHTTDKE